MDNASETWFQNALERLPGVLREAMAAYWRDFREAAQRDEVRIPAHPEFLRNLARVWAGSDYVAQSLVRDPELLRTLLDSGDLLGSYRPGEYTAKLARVLKKARSEDDLGVRLRRFRRREMVRIIWRDLSGWASLEETTGELSELAEACIDQALGHLHAWFCRDLGTPRGIDGKPISLVVLGMGKLGALELNLSSDVDLMFAYSEDGETRGRRPRIGNEEYFTRLGQRLIQVLDTITYHGFVFRVDMRLRPYGASGPLVTSFRMMEDYYQEQGREWERYAMIKARVVGGDRVAGEQLMKLLRPFVYRRYLDFGAFESLREMKQMIAREVRRKGLEGNVKLGAGGIREVEFVGQAFQLIRGGRVPELQERSIRKVLRVLVDKGYLPGFVSAELDRAYVFLRRVEHRLQAVADEQTQSLPTDEAGRARLAFSMGYPNWDAFEKDLQRHMRAVHRHFEQVAEAPQAESEGPASNDGSTQEFDALWAGRLDHAQCVAALAQGGFEAPDEVLGQVEHLRSGSVSRMVGRQGRERLNRLLPLLLAAAARARAPAETFKRTVGILEAIAGRSAYLALLVENPMALSQLVRLCAASPWIAGQLARHPLLLDELLDPRILYAPPQGRELESELRQQMLRIPEEDLEQQMEVLRHFRQVQVLRVAAADIVGVLPLMRVSDHLTEIAEVLLRQVLEVCWRHLTSRYGRPTGPGGVPLEPGFAIIAYGKLGGIELGYGSDLDLVFLHGGDPDGQTIGGSRSVENTVFFTRLGQRIIHVLSTLTPSGILYEVDMRLRPSGASGLLVSSVEGFAEYQRDDAWTWEHQALVRARAVAGDPAVIARFESVRREVLGRKRARGKLVREVREMRTKMREALGSGETGWFDLKQDPGGIADIEFMVQYGVLLWGAGHPELLRYTDNIRILEGLGAAGLVSQKDVALLSNGYRAYREVVHETALQQEAARVPGDTFEEYRREVSRVWNRLLGR